MEASAPGRARRGWRRARAADSRSPGRGGPGGLRAGAALGALSGEAAGRAARGRSSRRFCVSHVPSDGKACITGLAHM